MDPLQEDPAKDKLGPHLPILTKVEATDRIGNRFGSNNTIISKEGESGGLINSESFMKIGIEGFVVPKVNTPTLEHPELHTFPDIQSFTSYIEHLISVIASNNKFVGEIMNLKDIVSTSFT